MNDGDDPSESAAAWLAGGGEMGERLRRLDWASTPLGATAAWPQSLRSAVSILLPSKAQICLFWGPELIKLYNDAYIPVLGRKHPSMLGHPGREVWSEIWDVLGPLLEGVVATGEAFRATDHPFYLDRRGFPEETFFDVSYDPVRDETGRVGGVFCIVSETTGRVQSERRLRTLRDLGRAKEARSAAEACGLALTALDTHRHDLPFVSLSLLDETGVVAQGLGAVGIPGGGALSPKEIALADSRWPFAAVAESLRPRLIESLPPGAAAELPPTAAPDRTLVLPILRAGQCAGFIVAGTSRSLALEGDYRDFFDLVAAQIGTAVTQASSYEEERKRAEALAELDRAKTTFFSNVSHEFRTPLTLMLGPLEDLMDRAPGTAGAGDRETFAVMHRNGRRLLKLVNTLLEFSRIQAGRHEAAYEPTDLGALTADLAGVFRSTVEQAGLTFTVRCPAGREPVYVDRTMWEKIVLNLLSNAFKFTFEGAIAVELLDRGTSVDLVVRDTGIGIAPAEVERVFDRFHRVENARARTHEGSGIGLALVQELVRLHGGVVRVDSQPGQGSAFTVTLPRGHGHLPAERIATASTGVAGGVGGRAFVEEARSWLPDVEAAEVGPDAGPPPEHDGSARPARRLRVVVADDNADMREYVTGLLSPRWEVEAVGDGHTALATLRARPVDLLLTDVMMPGLDGFGLLRAVRAEPAMREIPVILLSARAGEESRVEGLEAGADDYMIKPFSARELIARVEAHLKLKELRAQAAAERQRLLENEQRARAAAEAASRAKDEFLAVLSHELRTPLNAVYGWARMLRSGEIHGEAVNRALDVIMRNANAQVQLIDDMLDVSRIVTGKMRLDVRPVDLGAVVEAALDVVRPAAEAKGLRLHPVLDPEAVSVTGDPNRLQQVVWNLLINAVKFTPRGGQIQVSLQRGGSHVEIIVSDTGQGISAEVLPHVFERFQQGDSTSTRPHTGLGVGLALVRHLVELHGGTVEASSAGAGRGATFTVELPVALDRAETDEDRPARARARPTAAEPVATSVPSLRDVRILVVDNDRDGLDLVAAILINGGAAVRTALSAAEGLATLRAWRPDVLISDIEMPGEDGYTFIRRVRTIDPASLARTPAIALTAYGRIEDRLRTLSAGYSMHIPKPLDPAELVMVVASLVRRT
jgi:signal transduction histidine kinase